jgi:Tfp pilus assembly protein FimT
MVVVAIIGVLVKISLPTIQNTILAYRLGAAASSVAAAIQQTRYQAIQVGCPYTIAFTTGSTTYQVQSEQISNTTPPTCAGTFTAAGPATSWATSGGGISVTSSATFQFSPGGIVTATVGGTNCPMPCSFALTNGSPSTRTIVVSGVGYVKVTTP